MCENLMKVGQRRLCPICALAALLESTILKCKQSLFKNTAIRFWSQQVPPQGSVGDVGDTLDFTSAMSGLGVTFRGGRSVPPPLQLCKESMGIFHTVAILL